MPDNLPIDVGAEYRRRLAEYPPLPPSPLESHYWADSGTFRERATVTKNGVDDYRHSVTINYDCARQLAAELCLRVDFPLPPDRDITLAEAYEWQDHYECQLQEAITARAKVDTTATEIERDETKNSPLAVPVATNINRRFANADIDRLRAFAAENLKGIERRVIELLCDNGGEMALADLAIDSGIEWTMPCKDSWESAMRRINKKLRGKILLRLHQHDNKARLK
jgi:hypothetical protein